MLKNQQTKLKMWIAAVAVCGLLGFCVAQEYKPSYYQPEGKSNYPQSEGKSNYPQPEGKSNYPQSGGKSNYPQPEGKSNYPQPSYANSAGPSYAYPAAPSYGNSPAPSYADSPAYRQRLGADYAAAQIDDIRENIEIIHDRQLLQSTRINYLEEASNRNRAFQNKVETIVSADINEAFEEQDERLYRLAEKLAAIRDLEYQVAELEQQAQEIRNSTEETVARDTETSRALAGGLEQDIAEEIENENDAALRIARGLQEVLNTSFSNARLLNQQESGLDKLEARLDYSKAQIDQVTITLDNQGIGSANVSFPGFPEEFNGYLTALHHIRRSGYYGAANKRDIEIETRYTSPGADRIVVLAAGDTPKSNVHVSVVAINAIGSQVN